MIALVNVDNIKEIPLDTEEEFKSISTKSIIHKVISEMKSFIL